MWDFGPQDMENGYLYSFSFRGCRELVIVFCDEKAPHKIKIDNNNVINETMESIEDKIFHLVNIFG